MTEHNIQLDSSELASLWSSYMAESATLPILNYFLNGIEDLEVKTLLEKAKDTSENHLKTLEEIFKQENYPIPVGFSEKDVNVEAPKLYSDTYVLYFLRNYGKAGIAANGMAVSFSARGDIRKLYKHYLFETVDIEDEAKAIMLSKGLFIRSPYIDTPERPTFVEKQRFLKGWFGERRTLTGEEIAHIYLNFTSCTYARALLIGFSQVAQTKEIREFFVKGTEILRGVMDQLLFLLEESSLPYPMTWDTEVKNSTTPPFSDRLMLFQASAITAIGIANLGGSLALSLRRDLAAKYMTRLKDLGLYAEDAANLLIKHGWFERPPQAINREHLTKGKTK